MNHVTLMPAARPRRRHWRTRLFLIGLLIHAVFSSWMCWSLLSDLKTAHADAKAAAEQLNELRASVKAGLIIEF